MRERDIEKYLVCKVKEAGRLLRKVKWIGKRGAPDRRVFGLAWVEVKKPGEGLQPHQEREIARMREHGERVEVIDSFEGVDRLLE